MTYTQEEKEKYDEEKPVVDDMASALKWFEMEMVDGPCELDCPQCNAYLYAIQALRIACIYANADWIYSILDDPESGKRLSDAARYNPVSMKDIADFVDMMMPVSNLKTAKGATKALIDIMNKMIGEGE